MVEAPTIRVQAAMRCAAAVAVGLSLSAGAQALIVGNQPGIVPDTTVNPASFPGWAQGDPGWYNVSASGSNYVYLGDGWVLSARHVGYNETAGVKFQTMLPDGSLGPVETFYRIPGDYYHDYGYPSGNSRQHAVSNPTTIQSETGQTISLAASNGTPFTDLQLFRISGDPGLPALTLPSQPLPQSFTRDDAPEVVAIGNGRSRQFTERTWYITIDPDDDTNWSWSLSEPETHDETKQGYQRNTVAVKQFGTNRLADPRPNGPGNPSDPDALDYSDMFKGVVSDTTAVVDLKTGDGVTRSVLAMMTVFDEQGTPGVTDLEFQAQSGNSGSSLFYKRGDQWELAGIINAIFTYPNQPGNTGVYGNATLITDLSYYYYPTLADGEPHPDDHHNSISHIMRTHANYSHLGDINLNGLVTGDGTGPPDADDVSAFLLGWGYDNGLGTGTIETWKKGDLNRDGKVDVEDFLLLRAALNGQISGAVLATLFGGDVPLDPGSGAVPEPSALALAGMAVAFLALAARRRRT